MNDELNNGTEISYSFSSRGPGGGGPGNGGPGSAGNEGLKTGDSVYVILECIDENVYDYFRTAGGDMSNSASPANPISNISNGALGYFNACTIRSESLVVQ